MSFFIFYKNTMDFLSFLNQDDYIIYNKQLAHKLWINSTIMLMDLISKYKYFHSRDSLDENWYFFNSIENVEKDTAIKRKAQDGAIKVLLGFWLIEKKTKWMPAKRYFKININKIAQLMWFTLHNEVWTNIQSSMSQKDKQESPLHTSSMSKRDKQDCPNDPSNKNNNKTNNKNKEIIETFFSFYPKIISPLKIETVINELIDNWKINSADEIKEWILNEINFKKSQAQNDPSFKVLWKDPINWLEGWDWKNKYNTVEIKTIDNEQTLINKAKEDLNQKQQKELDSIIADRKLWNLNKKKIISSVLKNMIEKVHEKWYLV